MAVTETERELARKAGLISSAVVCKRSGLTYRQLDYWTRKGLISEAVGPLGSGSMRFWEPSVVEEIRNLRARIRACPLSHPGHEEET